MVDKADVIRDVFHSFARAKREFGAVTERCMLKGWPDRKAEVAAATKVADLNGERELMRFEFLLAAIGTDAGVWNSVHSISDRMYRDWNETDEAALKKGNPLYVELLQDLRDAEDSIDPVALEGPYSGMSTDPEWQLACKTLSDARSKLDERLALLRPAQSRPPN